LLYYIPGVLLTNGTVHSTAAVCGSYTVQHALPVLDSHWGNWYSGVTLCC